MNSKVSFGLGMILGAAMGAAVSVYTLNSKYETRIEKEVASVKEAYAKLKEEAESAKEGFNSKLHEISEANREAKEKIAEKYKEVTETFGYSNPKDLFRFGSDVPVEPAEPKKADIPPVQSSLIEQKEVGDSYEIPEEEFGGDGEYRTVDLTYYSSGVLTDDQDEPIDDISTTIGENVMDELDAKVEAGFEDVFIRNPVRGTDYRISLIDETSEE